MKHLPRILTTLVFLGLALPMAFMGCDRRNNDYARYEQRAWELMNRADRESLLPTDILNNLNQAINLAPDRARTDSYYLRALCWDKVGEHEKAFQDRMVVIQREPNNPKSAKVYAALAAVLGERKEYQQAMGYIERSIELDPNYAASRVTRAMLYINNGIMDKWEADLSTAIELDPGITNCVDFQLIRDNAGKKLQEQNKGVQAIGDKSPQPDP